MPTQMRILGTNAYLLIAEGEGVATFTPEGPADWLITSSAAVPTGAGEVAHPGTSISVTMIAGQRLWLRTGFRFNLDAANSVIPTTILPPTVIGDAASLSPPPDQAMASVNLAALLTGTAPISFSLAPESQPLPAGVSLSSAGALSGTPTGASTGAILVAARNLAGITKIPVELSVTLPPVSLAISPAQPLAGEHFTVDWPADMQLVSLAVDGATIGGRGKPRRASVYVAKGQVVSIRGRFLDAHGRTRSASVMIDVQAASSLTLSLSPLSPPPGTTATVTSSAPLSSLSAVIGGVSIPGIGSGSTWQINIPAEAAEGAMIMITATAASGSTATLSMAVGAPPATPQLALAISPAAPQVGDLVTITGTITGGAAAGFAAISASLGGSPLALSGTGLVRTVTVAAAGALAVLASVSVDGQLIGASASAQVAPAAATAPAPFGDGDWTWDSSPATGNAILGITSIPANTTEIDYTFDDGATVHTLWRATTGTRYIPGLTPGATIPCKIRARRGALASDWSAVPKTAVAGAVAGLTPATLSVAPTYRWRADDAGIVTGVNAAGRPVVTSWPSSVGGGALTGADLEAAPILNTDNFGRKYVSTQIGTSGENAISLKHVGAAFDPRSVSVFIVGRAAQAITQIPVIVTDTEGAKHTAFGVNAGGGSRSGAQIVSNNSQSGSISPARFGSQDLCVMHMRENRGASQNQAGVNGVWDTYSGSIAATTATGIGIAKREGFDIYEVVVYIGALTAAQGADIAASLMTSYGLQAADSVVAWEGDSITVAIGGGIPQNNVAAQLARGGFIPANFRSVNCATSGATLADITTERDTASNWSRRYTAANTPGRRVCVLQIGRNDYASGLATIQTKYVAYLADPTNGLLALGWDVVICGNIGDSTTVANPVMASLRDWLATEAFLNDIGAGPGQPYEGRVQYRPVYIARVVSSYPLRDTVTTTPDPTYWADGTHPNALGTEIMATGGDDPTVGMLWDLV